VSERKHTPGPWLFGLHRYNDETNQYEVDVKPFDYAGPGYYDNPAILTADGTEIVGCDEYNVFGTPADRQLMCAAPDLLAALIALVAVNESHNCAMEKVIGRPTNWNDSYLDAARAAIAKATQPLNPA